MRKLAIAALVFACHHNEPTHHPEGAKEVFHWSYEGNHGPDHWGELDPRNTPCVHGHEQSPIDITAFAHDGALSPLELSYKDSRATLLNNGHTLQVNYEPGSSLRFGGQTYELVQFHFHAPSEHRVKGVAFPMEAHLVHKGADGHLAVIGVLFTEGEANPFLEKFWERAPTAKTELQTDLLLNAAELLPKSPHYYTYHGSLTTPPCSEGVSWILMEEPVSASAAQVERLHSLFGKNARPPQPLYDRPVLEY